MGKRKIIPVILVGLSACLIPLISHSSNCWHYAISLLIGLIIGQLIFARKSMTPKIYSIPTEEKKSEERKEEEPQKQKEEIKIIDLKEIKETSHLIQVGVDIKLIPRAINEEAYSNLISPWDRGDRIFPAIDPIFKTLLEKEELLSEITIRKFAIKKDGNDPLSYFSLLSTDPTNISLSAKTIIQYFIDNGHNLGQRNWFILNTKPEKDKNQIQIEDLRIVDIRSLENGKYFIYCYPCKHWSSFGGGWLEKSTKSQFIIPLY